MNEIIKENFSAIIGVLGTIVGVILGFILEKFARRGKIKVYQNEVKSFILEPDMAGGLIESNEINDKIESASIHLNIELFNTSEYSKKIMRDIIFRTESENYNIYDRSTSRAYGDGLTTDQFSSVHIEPKQVKDYYLRINFPENFKENLNSNWFITYRNHRNKKKTIKIDKSLLNK